MDAEECGSEVRLLRVELCRRAEFSDVSALVCLLCKITIENTFEKFYLLDQRRPKY
jgi:hypothetical protein